MMMMTVTWYDDSDKIWQWWWWEDDAVMMMMTVTWYDDDDDDSDRIWQWWWWDDDVVMMTALWVMIMRIVMIKINFNLQLTSLHEYIRTMMTMITLMMIKWWWDRWVRCNKAQEREEQNGKGKRKRCRIGQFWLMQKVKYRVLHVEFRRITYQL